MIAAAATVAFSYQSLLPTSPMTPDSAGYLAADGMRSAGYPAFLWAVRSLGLSLDGVVQLQTVLFALGVGWGCWAIGRGLGRRVLGWAMLAMLAANPFLWLYAGRIGTEALYIPLLCAMAGAMLLTTTEPRSVRHLILATICLALAISVRSVSITILPALLVVVLARGSLPSQTRMVQALGACGVLLFSTIIAGGPSDGSAGATARHAGLALLGQAAPLIREGHAPGLSSQDEASVTDATTRVRTWLDEAPSLQAWSLGREIVWNPLLYQVLGPHLETLPARETALRAIAASPGEYLRIVLGGLYSLWTLPQLVGPDTWQGELSSYLGGIPIAVPEEMARQSVKVVPELLVLAARGGTFGLTALALASTLVLAAALMRGWRLPRPIPPSLLAAGALGLAAHAHILATAVFAAGLPRYQLATLPILIASALCLASFLWNGVRSREIMRSDAQAEQAPGRE